MESRKITIVSTKDQKKSVIMTAAATLGELKNDLREYGIEFEDMTFYEGTSKTELRSDNSVLPHDVPFKGRITNELVFMLTNTDKKIKSGGLSRMEAYEKVKELGLQDACVKKYGVHFTNCSTYDLEVLINDALKEAEETSEYEVDSVKSALVMLLEALGNGNLIGCKDIKKIKNILFGKESLKSSYTEEEIDNMFDFV